MTLVLVVAIPLGAAIAIALIGGRLGRRTLGVITTIAMALSFGAGASMALTLRDRPSLDAFVAPWLPLPGADLALAVDSSMLAVALLITGVSALIALYSIDYLAHDRGLQRYFSAFCLLVAAMLLIVLGSNLVLVIVGWELAAVATYLLIAYHRDHAPAGAAASKAFVVERVGDAALIAGTFMLLGEFHTVDLAQLSGAANEHGSGAILGAHAIASGLLLIGALARSAQAPLHVWLPDSTEATTPVSAMLQTVAVTGGVVLLMRLRSVLVPDVLQIAAMIGGVSALAAAIVAMSQRDVRRVLAWSTIAQVGLMFVAAGVGALFAARFQLIAHGLLKAVLVLGAGSVRRATGDESDVARYGALGRRMPWTAGAFGIGTLALAGIPPAAGFFGIAAIASAALAERDAVLTGLVLLATAASAFAGVRLFVLMFVAPSVVARDAHEPPRLQDVPLAVLALGALGFGAVVSARILPIGSGPADDPPLWLLIATFTAALVGSIAGWLGHRHGLPAAERIGRVTRWARGGLGVDALYTVAIVHPFAAVARELEIGAEPANDHAVNAMGSVAVRASRVIQRYLPEGRLGQQTLLVVATIALVAFWTWSAR